MFTPEQTKQLQAPLDRSHVKERAQSGRKLSYIEGWHTISEANRIFGFDAWTRETMDIRCVAERERPIGQSGAQGWGVSYIAKVRVTVGAIIREGVGTGHGIDRDLGLAHESAIKEAETDAMKRALMTFGNPFGLALYDKTQANVVDETAPAPATARPAGAGKAASHERSPAPANPDGLVLAGLTAGMKFSQSNKDMDDWIAQHAEQIAGLSMDEAELLHARIKWWRDNKLPKVAA